MPIQVNLCQSMPIHNNVGVLLHGVGAPGCLRAGLVAGCNRGLRALHLEVLLRHGLVEGEQLGLDVHQLGGALLGGLALGGGGEASRSEVAEQLAASSLQVTQRACVEVASLAVASLL